MIQLRRVPGFPLNRHVACLWHYEGERRRRELALPTGAADLILRLDSPAVRVFSGLQDVRGERIYGPVVAGAHSHYFVLDKAPRAASVGVHFRAGGVGPVLGVPAAELTDRHTALEGLWGRQARRLQELLTGLPSPAERLRELERILTDRLRGDLACDGVATEALRRFQAAPGEVTVAEVVAASGLSAKRFIRLFKRAVGLTPKRYCRILRLQSVIDQVSRRPPVDWARLAANHGYYDQSHLIHDFKAIAGLTPARYRPVDAASPNHVAV